MPKLTSSYTGGLSRDLAISKNDNKHIYDALDIDLVTDLGESTAIISNHRGNSFQFRIPDVYRMFSITIDYTPPIVNTNLTILTSGGPVVTTINLSALADSVDVYNQIIANPLIAAAIAAGEFGVYYNSQEVIIQSYSVLADPTSSTTSLVVTTLVPNQRDLSIIGWCTLEEEIVLFTTSKYNTDPDPANTTPTAGQIWALQYNDATESIIGLAPGGFLNPAVHLKYNNIINFSLANEIYREALGRKESNLTGSVYWTDDYNYPRAFNIYNTQGPAIPPGLLDWKPSVDMSTPIIEAVIEGGQLLVGSYQIGYQLYTNDGASTAYSPASTLVPITDSSLLGQPYQYDGAEVETPSGKAIITTINHIDLRYDFIRIVLIDYAIIDLPVISIVYDVPINGDSMTFTVTGGEPKVGITNEEFVNPLIFFDRCKTFTQKKNRLYPANTRTKNFDVNFDSRAYRFDNTQVCKVFSRDGSYKLIDNTTFQIYDVNGVAVTPYNVPDNEDLVNPYNDESGKVYGLLLAQDYDFWLANYQYKYQSDGVTLGGEGLNVSYKFVYKQYRGDDKYLNTTDPSFPIADNGVDTITGLKKYFLRNTPLVEPINTFPVGTVENLGTPPLDGFDHPIDGWDTLKNPLYSTIFASYARGEVYRFGLVFYNEKGEESFVKWVSDIRIPEPWEGLLDAGDLTSFADLSYYDTTVNLELRGLGVEFTITNLPADITGFRVVRVERQPEDKTRTGIGMLTGPMSGKIDLSASGKVENMMLASFSNTAPILNAGDPRIPMFFLNNDFSTSTAPALHGPFDFPTNQITRYTNLGVVKSPDIDFGNTTAGDAQYLKLLNKYEWPEYYYTGKFWPGGQEFLNSGVGYYSQYIESASAPDYLDDRPAGAFHLKLRNVTDGFFTYGYIPDNNGRGRNIVTLSNQTEVDIEGIVPSTFSPAKMAGKDYHHIATYTLPDTVGLAGSVRWELSGFATKALFCDLDGVPYFVDNANSITGSHINNTENNNRDTLFRLIALCRTNYGQYGGPWRSARYNNTYISCSDFIPSSVTAPVQSLKVFSGDVFVSFYTTTLTFFHWKEAYGYDNASPSGLGSNYDPVAEEMCAIAVCFPAECASNLEYRDGKYWAKDQVFTSNTTRDVWPDAGNLNNDYPLSSDFAKFLADEYTYNLAYSQQNNLKIYNPLPFNFATDETHPNWVWVSQQKTDRETIDSWRRYLINDYLPLEAIYGPINKITNLKEMLLTYQDRAVAQVSSQEVTALPDSGTGAVFQVGTGNVLARYDYLSKEFGAFHQHGVVTGPAAVYNFDIRSKKFFRIAQGLENISDVKGLAAFFRDSLYGEVLNTDTVLLNRGIHGAYDSKYNKVYFTFENIIWLKSIGVPAIISGNSITFLAGSWELGLTQTGSETISSNKVFDSLPFNTQVKINDYLYNIQIDIVNGALVLTFVDLITVPGSIGVKPIIPININYTIAYNEMLQAFESFYSFKPTLYLPTGKRLFSANPYNINNSVYLHNDGNFGQFYDQDPSTSEVEFILNFPDATKVPTLRIDTLEFWTEVFDANGIDVPLETISGILLYNDYQSTGSSLTLLTPQVNVVRRERTWRINQLRDDVATYGVKSFLRDKYVKIKIFYNNQNNRYFRLNEFNTNVTLSYY
jgi:hypothetical protein